MLHKYSLFSSLPCPAASLHHGATWDTHKLFGKWPLKGKDFDEALISCRHWTSNFPAQKIWHAQIWVNLQQGHFVRCCSKLGQIHARFLIVNRQIFKGPGCWRSTKQKVQKQVQDKSRECFTIPTRRNAEFVAHVVERGCSLGFVESIFMTFYDFAAKCRVICTWLCAILVSSY